MNEQAPCTHTDAHSTGHTRKDRQKEYYCPDCHIHFYRADMIIVKPHVAEWESTV